MKKTVFLLVLVCISALRLNGQIDRQSKQFEYLLPDSLITNPLFKFQGNNFELYSDKLFKPDLDLKNHFPLEFPENKYSFDKMLEDRFPGSENFYAERRYLISPNEKTFAAKPDTTAKFYLIIIDPFTHKRVN